MCNVLLETSAPWCYGEAGGACLSSIDLSSVQVSVVCGSSPYKFSFEPRAFCFIK